MKTAIIIHGTPGQEDFLDPNTPSQSNLHWIPWLQNQLLIKGYHTWTPEMPLPYAPDYELWREEFERYSINEESLVVGHSCGGGFLLRWLSENSLRVKRVVLVAPWLDPNARKCPEFFDFQIDSGVSERTDLHMFASDNDNSDINESVEQIHSALPSISYKVFSGYGHFCMSDMESEPFSALLETLLG